VIDRVAMMLVSVAHRCDGLVLSLPYASPCSRAEPSPLRGLGVGSATSRVMTLEHFTRLRAHGHHAVLPLAYDGNVLDPAAPPAHDVRRELPERLPSWPVDDYLRLPC